MSSQIHSLTHVNNFGLPHRLFGLIYTPHTKLLGVYTLAVVHKHNNNKNYAFVNNTGFFPRSNIDGKPSQPTRVMFLKTLANVETLFNRKNGVIFLARMNIGGMVKV